MALCLADVGAFVFCKEGQQVKRHELAVHVIDHAHTAGLALCAPAPTQFANATSAFHQVTRFRMRRQVVDDVQAFRSTHQLLSTMYVFGQFCDGEHGLDSNPLD